MAKILKMEKPFLLIECTAGEMMDATGSRFCICDWCDKPFLPSNKGCYIAVLNQWYCEECFEERIEAMEYYPEDADVERRNFDFYAPRLGINAKCQ